MIFDADILTDRQRRELPALAALLALAFATGFGTGRWTSPPAYLPAVAQAPPTVVYGGPVQPATKKQQAGGPLAAALTQYNQTLPGVFVIASNAVRSGQVKTKADGVALLASHSDRLATELDAAFARHCDAGGTIVDAAGLAGELQAAGKAIGAR